jgi:hypothetical protein
MNYLKIYCNLIRKAENRVPPEDYTEKHHIFPKSIFGNNNRIVILTGREHYIAHTMLEKIYIKRYGLKDKRTIKMIHAHTLMKSKGKYYNSYLYNLAVIRKSEVMKGKKPYIMTEETKIKMSISKSGENHPKFGIPLTEEHKNKLLNSWRGKMHSEESKLKISKANKGRTHTEETKKKWSEARSGEKHYLYGKKMNVEIVNKIVEKKSKQFLIINPEGEIICGKNIAKFCRENNLDKATVCNMLNYKRGIKSHKGYRAVPQES